MENINKRWFLWAGLFCISFTLWSQSINQLESKFQEFLELELFDDAIALKLEIIEEFRKENEYTDLGFEMMGLSQIYSNLYQYDKQKLYLDSALLVRERYNIPIVSDYNAYLNSLYGKYFSQIELRDRAIDAFKKSLHIDTILLKKDSTIDPSYIGADYENIGTQFGKKGDYEQAIIYYKQALPFYENSSIDKAYVYQNLAIEYTLKKDWGNALNFYKKALEILKEKDINDNGLLIDINNNLGVAYAERYNFEKSNRYFAQVKSLLKSTERNRLARYYQQIGKNYYLQKQYNLAKKNYLLALQIRQKDWGSKHPYVARSYQGLAANHAAQNNHQQALQSYQKALTSVVWDFNDSLDYSSNPTIDQDVSDKPLLLELLNEKAQSLNAFEEQELALETYLLAAELIEDLLKNYHATGSKFILLEKAVPIYERAIATAIQLERPEQAFELAERNKAFVLLNNIKNLQAQDIANLTEEEVEHEKELKIKIAFNEKELYRARREGNKPEETRFQQRVFELKQQLQQFLEQLEQQNPTYYQLKYNLQSIPLATVQQELLEPRQLLIEYFMGDSSIFAFAVTQDELRVYEINDAISTRKLLQTLRKTVQQPSSHLSDFKQFHTTAFQLYQRLLQPVLTNIPKEVSQLCIVSDGALGYVPMQILLTEAASDDYEEPRYDKLAYLLNDYQISYAYSATLLQEIQNLNQLQQPNAQEVGLFAPIFKGEPALQRDGEILDNLMHSQREVATIDSIVNGQLYLAKAANLANFKENLAQYKVLHLSTHATVDDKNPLDSRIHFIDDYISTNEIYNLPLSAELVVLSACNTGSGVLRRGEGILSLARAFAYAGCPSMVTSLWKVNDVQTSDLMIHFYKNLFAVQSKDAALRNAQLTYLNNIQSYENAHPYYWGAFVQIGATKEIVENDFFKKEAWKWGVLAVLTLLSLFFLLKNKRGRIQ